jgi:hypothetical protein
VPQPHVRTVCGATGGRSPFGYPGGPDRGTAPGRQDHARPKDGRRRPNLYHAGRSDGSRGGPVRSGRLHPRPGPSHHRRDPARARPAAGDQEDGRRGLSAGAIPADGIGERADPAADRRQSGRTDGNHPDAAAGKGRDRRPDADLPGAPLSRESSKASGTRSSATIWSSSSCSEGFPRRSAATTSDGGRTGCDPISRRS